MVAVVHQFAGVLLLLGLSGCSVLQIVNTVSPLGDVERYRDITYSEAVKLSLDVFTPPRDGLAVGSSRPVIVFVYGGSWQNGSKNEYPFVASTLARQGFVVVIPNYRVYPDVRFPVFVDDIAEATQWTFENIADFGGDPNNVFLSGHSAGAHIAALVHFDERFLQRANAQQRPKGFIGLSGPYDFLPLVSDTLKQVFPEESRPDSQPINFVDGTEGPSLLLHGEKDDTVKPRNSASMAEKINSAGGRAELILYPSRDHAGLVLALARPLKGLAPVVEDITRFVNDRSSQPVAALGTTNPKVD